VTQDERSIENERKLHQALRVHAETLTPVALTSSSVFQSFFIGGFECSTHRRRDGKRLDLIASTQHDTYARSDYLILAEHRIRTVRDGLRWPLIETTPGVYDWSSFLPMLRAAKETGTQVIWDLCHWGWPDDLEIWSPAFVDRFAAFAHAVAQVVRNETDQVPFYVPVNEISFWAWAGGDLALINPLAIGRGNELKVILARATIAGIEAVRGVDPLARIAYAEPAIHVIPRSAERQDVQGAHLYTLAQFEALDLISGRSRPELGGRGDYIDLVGVNYYLHNQWVDGDLPVGVDHPQYRPFRKLIADVYHRYKRPVFVAETGIEGDLRVPWLRMMSYEAAQARHAGVPVAGLCLYPITDYPGWDDDRHCPTGLLGYVGADGRRPVDQGLAQELRVLTGL
jgi:beta-glucosidase/6-phospho-beta-glucosidase/beta-galactosidase